MSARLGVWRTEALICEGGTNGPSIYYLDGRFRCAFRFFCGRSVFLFRARALAHAAAAALNGRARSRRGLLRAAAGRFRLASCLRTRACALVGLSAAVGVIGLAAGVGPLPGAAVTIVWTGHRRGRARLVHISGYQDGSRRQSDDDKGKNDLLGKAHGYSPQLHNSHLLRARLR